MAPAGQASPVPTGYSLEWICGPSPEQSPQSLVPGEPGGRERGERRERKLSLTTEKALTLQRSRLELLGGAQALERDKVPGLRACCDPPAWAHPPGFSTQLRNTQLCFSACTFWPPWAPWAHCHARERAWAPLDLRIHGKGVGGIRVKGSSHLLLACPAEWNLSPSSAWTLDSHCGPHLWG